MYDRVLIPVDGSDEAAFAAKRGLELARTFDATVDVIHVVEQTSLRLTRTSGEGTRLRERGKTILAEIEEIATEHGQPITTEVVEGRPAVRISEYAVERDAALIVMGRQGITGLGKRLLGGVTEQVLHRSDIPVLVVPGDDRTSTSEIDYARVLVPTDGSENAAAAARHGAWIANRYGSVIHVLNVVDLQSAGGVFTAGGLKEEFVERLEARGREAVDGIADGITEAAPGVDVTTDVVRTTEFEGVAAGVREYVTDHDIDLVVMGSHGRSNLKRQLLGSVTSTLLRSVDVPVLVVKRPS